MAIAVVAGGGSVTLLTVCVLLGMVFCVEVGVGCILVSNFWVVLWVVGVYLRVLCRLHARRGSPNLSGEVS